VGDAEFCVGGLEPPTGTLPPAEAEPPEGASLLIGWAGACGIMAGLGSGGTEPALIFPKRSRSDIRAVFSSSYALRSAFIGLLADYFLPNRPPSKLFFSFVSAGFPEG
jgi:hypothetical protein